MSPSGRLLAVGGTGGLQIFHYNGASPITHYTGLLTTDEIDQFFWDNQNHMYAISQTSGKLFVFTVTPTSYSQSPGSPYTISSPISIIVQPLPRY
jgi:outer membrane protein assembly factor BamB